MSDNDMLQMLATITAVIHAHEVAARDIEVRIDVLREVRGDLLASIQPAHLVDDLQLVVPL